MKKLLVFGITIAMMVSLFACGSSPVNSNEESADNTAASTSVVVTKETEDSSSETVEYAQEDSEKDKEVSADAVSDSVTMGEKNALSSAENYLNIMAFSYSGLIEQLEYEGYSNEEATYAADNCGADWDEQAAKKAQEYLDAMSFSRSGLIEQLEYEGFTASQAEYGVSAVGY